MQFVKLSALHLWPRSVKIRISFFGSLFAPREPFSSALSCQLAIMYRFFSFSFFLPFNSCFSFFLFSLRFTTFFLICQRCPANLQRFDFLSTYPCYVFPVFPSPRCSTNNVSFLLLLNIFVPVAFLFHCLFSFSYLSARFHQTCNNTSFLLSTSLNAYFSSKC